ncbi:MAG: hypothetical protein R3E84_16070 [Pseudomonadales bacterium]
MYHAQLLPCRWSMHFTQILAGLVELESAGELALHVGGTPRTQRTTDSGHVLHLHIDDGARVRRLAFDMRDGRDIDEAAMAASDVYFKRSYDTIVHKSLHDRGLPIVPYGFNYGCVATSAARQQQLSTLLQKGASNLPRTRNLMKARYFAWDLGKSVTSRGSDPVPNSGIRNEPRCSSGSEGHILHPSVVASISTQVSTR